MERKKNKSKYIPLSQRPKRKKSNLSYENYDHFNYDSDSDSDSDSGYNSRSRGFKLIGNSELKKSLLKRLGINKLNITIRDIENALKICKENNPRNHIRCEKAAKSLSDMLTSRFGSIRAGKRRMSRRMSRRKSRRAGKRSASKRRMPRRRSVFR